MDIDVTLFFQLAIFLMVLLTLNGLLFKPFLRVIEARHQKIHGMKDDVDRLERLSAADRIAYESRMRDARRDAQRNRESLRNAGREEERRLLTQTRLEISQSLNAKREQVASVESSAKKGLAVHTDALAQQLVQKVLGREVGA